MVKGCDTENEYLNEILLPQVTIHVCNTHFKEARILGKIVISSEFYACDWRGFIGSVGHEGTS